MECCSLITTSLEKGWIDLANFFFNVNNIPSIDFRKRRIGKFGKVLFYW